MIGDSVRLRLVAQVIGERRVFVFMAEDRTMINIVEEHDVIDFAYADCWLLRRSSENSVSLVWIKDDEVVKNWPPMNQEP